MNQTGYSKGPGRVLPFKGTGGGGGNLFLGNPEHLRQYALRQLAFASDDFENLGLQLLHLGGSRIQLRLGLLL